MIRSLVQFLTALQVVAAVALLACAATVYVSPASWPLASVVTMGFPFFLLAALVIGGLALIFTPRRVWITLVALLLCIGCIRNFAPINIPRTPAPDDWHVMTWNMGGTQWNDSTLERLRQYLTQQRLDILVVQEISSPNADELAQLLHSQMPYSRFYEDSQWYGHTIVSRWPVIDYEKITQNGANRAILYRLQSPLADTLFVISCHLQSMHLDAEVRSGYSAIVHRQETDPDSVEHTSHTLLSHIMDNGALRALQADTVASFLNSHADRPLIIAGDLNDTPVSYTRQRIFEAAPLYDCWRSAGNGLGRSFNRDAIYVRIDHIFCGKSHFSPKRCVMDTTRISDHYPLHCWLETERQ